MTKTFPKNTKKSSKNEYCCIEGCENSNDCQKFINHYWINPILDIILLIIKSFFVVCVVLMVVIIFFYLNMLHDKKNLNVSIKNETIVNTTPIEKTDSFEKVEKTVKIADALDNDKGMIKEFPSIQSAIDSQENQGIVRNEGFFKI